MEKKHIARASPMARIIGHNLERARRRAGLTQKALASTLNLSTSAYRHYAKGRHLFPSDLFPCAVATLETTVEQLLGMPDPAGLDEDERYLIEARRAIRAPRIRAGIIGHAREQLMIDQELWERRDPSAPREAV